MKVSVNLKKVRFALASIVMLGATYYISNHYGKTVTEEFVSADLGLDSLLLTACVSILISLFVQYIDGGDRGPKELVYVGLTPFTVCLAALFFYFYYPNLSIAFKFLAGLFYASMLYTLLLLNNVLLVVKTREEVIPVYRVASAWVQIILLSSAVSIFAGMHKVTIQPLFQSVGVILLSIFYFFYSLWVYSFDRDARTLKSLESIVMVLSLSLLTGWASFITLFISGESFLRGLFVSSVFLVGMGYIQLYSKNSLSKRSLKDYIILAFIFLFIFILFKP